MQKWESLICSAKKAYMNHAYDDAIKLNQDALLVSRSQFEAVFSSADPEKAVASVLVSYFNLTDAYIGENQLIKASSLFEEVLNFLDACNRRPDKVDKQISAIENGINQLSFEWTFFLKKHSVYLPTSSKNVSSKLPSSLYQPKQNTVIH